MNVIGYLRVSTQGQDYGIEAQRTAIRARAQQQGWAVGWIEDAGRSGKDINRSGITHALELLRSGEAEALVVSKLDRLSRSLADFARVMETASKQGWGLVAIDLGIDTTTPTGQLVVNIMASVSQWERQMIGLRTKEGLAEARRNGVRLGSPVRMDPAVERRILAERGAGKSLASIARSLNDDQTPTPTGSGSYYPSTIRATLRRVESAGLYPYAPRW